MPDDFPYSNARLFAIREDRARGKALAAAFVLVLVLTAVLAVFFIFLMSGGHDKTRNDAPTPGSPPSTSTS